MKKFIFLLLLVASSVSGDLFWVSSSYNVQADIIEIEKDNLITSIIPGRDGDYIISYRSSKWPEPKK